MIITTLDDVAHVSVDKELVDTFFEKTAYYVGGEFYVRALNYFRCQFANTLEIHDLSIIDDTTVEIRVAKVDFYSLKNWSNIDCKVVEILPCTEKLLKIVLELKH